MLQVIDYYTIANRFYTQIESREYQDVSCRECVKLVDSVSTMGTNKRNRGDEAADSLLDVLDKMGVTRTPGQKRFHREFMNACLPHIYGSDNFDNDRERILARYGFADVKFEVLVCCPRRWGKTYSVALFIAGLLWTVPDIWVSIFSTGQRASTSLLELIAKFIAVLSDGENRVLAKNKELIYVRGENAADIRKAYSYPSSVQVYFFTNSLKIILLVPSE